MTEATTQQEPETITVPASHDTVTVDPASLSPGEAKAMIDTLRTSPALTDTGHPGHGDAKSALERLYGRAYPDGDDAPSGLDKAAEEAFTPVDEPDSIDLGRLNWVPDEPYDAETEQAARVWAVDAGFSQPEIDGVLSGINAHQRQTEEQRERAYQSTLSSLRHEWGDGHEDNVASIVEYARAVGGDPLLNFLIGTGLANDHNFLTTALRHARAKGY